MKKKGLILISLLLSLCVAFGACSGGYPNKKTDKVPDASYAVVGNGGLSVQQGPYIYFVNGYAEIADTDGKSNVWGNVVKGGIYRIDMTAANGKEPTELVSTTDASVATSAGRFLDPYQGYYGGEYKTVATAAATTVQNGDVSDVTGFAMKTAKDADEKEYAAIDATPIVPKKVSNGGFTGGGIYIFENWIYYCTPVSKKNKDGAVQYKLVDFMRTSLDGAKTELIYESSSTENLPTYGYYRYGGMTYLAVLDDGVLKTVACKDRGGIRSPYTVCENTESVLFSNKPIYYSGMREDGIEDFVYFTRVADSQTKGDDLPNGSVLERVRPDGSASMTLLNNNTKLTLRNVTNGYLYYSEEKATGETMLYATDLASYPLTADGTASRRSDIYELTTVTSSVTTLTVGNTVNAYNAATGKLDVSHYAIAGNNGQTIIVTAPGEQTVLLAMEVATVIGVDGDLVYYYVEKSSDDSTETNSLVYAVRIGENLPLTVSSVEAIVTDFFPPEVTAGYLFYAAPKTEIPSAIDENTDERRNESGYLHLKRVSFLDDEPDWFVGAFKPEDLENIEKTEESDDENTESAT